MSNLAATQAAYEGFSRGDMNPLFSILADDIIWYSHSLSTSPFHGTYKGIPAVQSYFGNMEKVDLTKFDIKSMTEAGNSVIVILDARRVTKATGEVMEGQVVHVWQYAGDKIVQGDLYEASANVS